ncbi:hypothetical protein HHI36_013783 [Cryptolaemus montrouzieri]|uniref:Uncharacterized protein n=1 Tax=Cryptolaemus montrouzieri TaxID=559131 RepID=A0ABD2NI80_9CUCU
MIMTMKLMLFTFLLMLMNFLTIKILMMMMGACDEDFKKDIAGTFEIHQQSGNSLLCSTDIDMHAIYNDRVSPSTSKSICLCNTKEKLQRHQNEQKWQEHGMKDVSVIRLRYLP